MLKSLTGSSASIEMAHNMSRRVDQIHAPVTVEVECAVERAERGEEVRVGVRGGEVHVCDAPVGGECENLGCGVRGVGGGEQGGGG